MEPGPRAQRLRAMGGIAVSTVLLAVGLTGWGVLRNGSAPATWVLATKQDVSARTSEFDVLVTRTGCNGGVNGDVLPRQVDRHNGEVVLTFTVEPNEPSSAPCPGNDAVRYRVRLD